MMLLHGDLVRSINETECPVGGLLFWWIGQHSFVVRAGSHVLYIDPYLSPSRSRRTPPLLAPEEVTNAQYVLCTHDHGDHIDPGAIPGIAAASPRAIFVASRVARDRMRSLNVEEKRLVSLDAGDVYRTEGVAITAVKSRHEFFDRDPALGYPYLGYVVEAAGVTFYHSGDTIPYDGLVATLADWRFDAMFLPINGRDARRFKTGCIGNLTYQEAVDLAGDVGPRYAIPAHYEMFQHNSANPLDFVEYLGAKYPNIGTWVGEPGEPVVIPPAD
jgi:L-ascorbate metabolism protein UlaG (beta-lactamase superfamily)